MIVDKISIQPLFPTASYLNVRVGIEGTKEPFETTEEALDRAYQMALDFHRKHFPMFYDEKGTPKYHAYLGDDELPILQNRER